MPRLLDFQTRTDDLAFGMALLIQRHGLSAPSTRAIAREIGISVGTLSHQFETRERLIGVLASGVARLYMENLEDRVGWQGVPALVPDPADEDPTAQDAALLVRGRLALDELGRASDHAAHTVGRLDDFERWILGGLRSPRRTARPGEPPAEAGAAALLSGLRTAVHRQVDPLPAWRAVELLRGELIPGEDPSAAA